MGRWTVAEWLAQTEAEDYLGGTTSLRREGRMVRDIEPELGRSESDDSKDGKEEGRHGKHLPPSPNALTNAYDEPPTPPPKTYLSGVHSWSGAPRLSADEEDSGRSSGGTKGGRRTRGKRGKSSRNNSVKTMQNGDPIYVDCRPEVVVESPSESRPRSQPARRPREFFSRSTPPKSKFRMTDGYTFNGQALEILVSTQVTATQSAHDAGRPRVFYPRSSSLPSAMNNLTPPPPLPPKDTPQARTHRALPAPPLANEPKASTNSKSTTTDEVASNGARRLRPLPVPRPPS
ncbi:hypothetical protein R3P38DRAFT_2983452 [Favolaschia claudopus]|uniref:Uncharacterized protein n=1 Tax=Favolaschia claudopus TaxID=2862362 RepID=A0AAW0B084_9AGAR